MANINDMYLCQVSNCGYIYNPDRGDRKGGIPHDTRFEDLPDTWLCPLCGVGKELFCCIGEAVALQSTQASRR
jgi:rubredoxin